MLQDKWLVELVFKGEYKGYQTVSTEPKMGDEINGYIINHFWQKDYVAKYAKAEVK
jgi:hypothetical protein